MEKTCPIHQKELRQFKGIGKVSGKPYENWKCTYKDDKGYCEYIEWVDQIEVAKKFTQLPNGHVLEEEAEWPLKAPQTLNPAPGRTEASNADIMDSLSRLHVKINKLLGNAEEN